MLEDLVSPELLSPIQSIVDHSKVRRIIRSFQPGKFHSIPLLETEGKLYIVDGHHRCVSGVLAGFDVLPVTILQSSEDINLYTHQMSSLNRSCGALRHGVKSFFSRLYSSCISECEEAGIKNLLDLAEKTSNNLGYFTL